MLFSTWVESRLDSRIVWEGLSWRMYLLSVRVPLILSFFLYFLFSPFASSSSRLSSPSRIVGAHGCTMRISKWMEEQERVGGAWSGEGEGECDWERERGLMTGIDQVLFTQNTSPIPDEMLAHRLGMVPLISQKVMDGLRYTRVSLSFSNPSYPSFPFISSATTSFRGGQFLLWRTTCHCLLSIPAVLIYRTANVMKVVTSVWSSSDSECPTSTVRRDLHWQSQVICWK
jgi:hypothetical protein